ncbi:MAG: hypothetical protein [Siphoviridae sp. ctjeG17]|nr:MAG: hypothetical protein [Siphoviridae sp. ctjeG17]
MAILHHIFTDIAQLVGLDFSTLLVLVIFFVGFIAYAKGIEIGSLVQLTLMALVFMFDIVFNLDYTIPLVLMFISIIILAFSIFNSRNQVAGLV